MPAFLAVDVIGDDVGHDEDNVDNVLARCCFRGVHHGGSLPQKVARGSLHVQDVVTRYAHQRGYHVERRRSGACSCLVWGVSV